MTNDEFTAWHDRTGLCGCGTPVASMELIRDILHAHTLEPWQEKHKAIKELLPTEGLLHLVLSVLDEWCLIEHGSCIDCAWLTENGKDLLSFLADKAEDDIDKAIFPWQ